MATGEIRKVGLLKRLHIYWPFCVLLISEQIFNLLISYLSFFWKALWKVNVLGGKRYDLRSITNREGNKHDFLFCLPSWEAAINI